MARDLVLAVTLYQAHELGLFIVGRKYPRTGKPSSRNYWDPLGNWLPQMCRLISLALVGFPGSSNHASEVRCGGNSRVHPAFCYKSCTGEAILRTTVEVLFIFMSINFVIDNSVCILERACEELFRTAL